jgi:protein-tyrosine phosphatase
MPSILFVCTANLFRSPIAAACFSECLSRKNWSGEWNIQSAGVWTTTGIPALPIAQTVAERLKLTLERHRSSMVSAEMIAAQDLILVMENGQKEALQSEFPLSRANIFLLSEVVEKRAYDIQDPIQDRLDRCVEVGFQIQDLIDKGFYRICDRAIRLQRLRR